MYYIYFRLFVIVNKNKKNDPLPKLQITNPIFSTDSSVPVYTLTINERRIHHTVVAVVPLTLELPACQQRRDGVDMGQGVRRPKAAFHKQRYSCLLCYQK